MLTEHTMTKIMCCPRLKPKRRYLATHKHLETGSFSMGLFKKRKSRATRKAEAKALKHKAEVEAKLNAKSQRKRDKVETKSLKRHPLYCIVAATIYNLHRFSSSLYGVEMRLASNHLDTIAVRRALNA